MLMDETGDVLATKNHVETCVSETKPLVLGEGHINTIFGSNTRIIKYE